MSKRLIEEFVGISIILWIIVRFIVLLAGDLIWLIAGEHLPLNTWGVDLFCLVLALTGSAFQVWINFRNRRPPPYIKQR